MEEYYLRNYLLRNANNNVDIFEFIKKAITVAATHYPHEFHNKKDKIIDTLHSCIKNTQEDDDDSQKQISIPKMACDDQPKAKRPTIRIVYPGRVAEVLRIKEVLEGESESVVICDLLAKLRYIGLTVNTLEVTGIGKTVKVFRKHASRDVSKIAGRLLKEWKDMVEEWLKYNDASCVAHPTLSDKEKENRTSMQRANNETVVDVVVKEVVLPAVSKPVVDLVAKTQSGIPHQQSKPIDARMPKRMIEKISEDKLKAVKRKLHQAYEDAENMKKKRRIQVLAFHELPKKGLLPKQTPHIKPRGHQLRRRGDNAIRSIVRAH